MERILAELYRDLWDARQLKQDGHPSPTAANHSQRLEGRIGRGMKFVPLLIFAQSALPSCRYETFEDGQPDAVDQYSEKLRSLELNKFTVQKELTAMRALQSERAGVTGV